MSQGKREKHVRFLNRFNIDTFENLRQWSDTRLEQSVRFVQSELKRAKARA